MLLADEKLIRWLLDESGISRYRIWKDTGIPETTLSDLATGKTLIENMFFKKAAKLTEYAKIIKDGGDTKMTKLTGIKKAVGEYNNWQGHAEIMLDKESGKVWCDVFASGQEWKNYHDENVVRLLTKAINSMWERDDTTSMREINEKAKESMKEEK